LILEIWKNWKISRYFYGMNSNLEISITFKKKGPNGMRSILSRKTRLVLTEIEDQVWFPLSSHLWNNTLPWTMNWLFWNSTVNVKAFKQILRYHSYIIEDNLEYEEVVNIGPSQDYFIYHKLIENISQPCMY
jgi:hypothetical protein